MRAQRFGGAIEAAEVLGVSRAQFDKIRTASVFVYDAGSGERRRLTAKEASDRGALRRLHLIAPAVFGQKLPAGVWEYDLLRLRRQREDPAWLTDPPPAGRN